MTAVEPLPLSEASRRRWDVLIVGAGLAGSLAAYGLARQGLDVLLVDRAAFPRWKVCGSCLNPAALAILADAGLGELTGRCGAVPVQAMRLRVWRRQADIAVPGWQVLSRERFDAALVTAAVEAGAAFLPRTQATLGPASADTRSVQLRQQDEEASTEARLVLAADGLGGRLLAGEADGASMNEAGSRIGAGVIAEQGADRYAAGIIHMAYGTGGYVGLVRLEDGRLNIATALDVDFVRTAHNPGVAVERLLHEVGWPAVPNLADLPWRGTPALTRQPARPAAERVLALGDAAGYVEPFTGEGMGWALASAAAVVPLAWRAARSWQHGMADEWTAAHRHSAGPRQRLCRAMTWLSRHPMLAHTLIGIVGRWPWLATPFVNHVQRTQTGPLGAGLD